MHLDTFVPTTPEREDQQQRDSKRPTLDIMILLLKLGRHHRRMAPKQDVNSTHVALEAERGTSEDMHSQCTPSAFSSETDTLFECIHPKNPAK